MAAPRRLKRQTGRHALVDGIPFQLPVASERSPALMAVFPIDAERAQALIPGNEIHVLRWGKRALLIVTVIDYRFTNIGKYVEYSIAIACTHGRRRKPIPVALMFPKSCGTGQYVLDLPVSSLISVKGGKGIWGMPKHQASLDFTIDEETVSSRYDLDGRMIIRVEVKRPARARLPLSAGAINYCSYRGMLFKSYIHFKGKMGFSLLAGDSARIELGDHPRAEVLRQLDIGRPLFSGFFPESAGVLDDHFECWFESSAAPPAQRPEGMESVIDLPLSEDWLPPPGSTDWAGAAGPPVAPAHTGVNPGATIPAPEAGGESPAGTRTASTDGAIRLGNVPLVGDRSRTARGDDEG